MAVIKTIKNIEGSPSFKFISIERRGVFHTKYQFAKIKYIDGNTPISFILEFSYNTYVSSGEVEAYLIKKIGDNILEIRALAEIFHVINQNKKFSLFCIGRYTPGIPLLSNVHLYIDKEGIWFQKGRDRTIIASALELNLLESIYKSRKKKFAKGSKGNKLSIVDNMVWSPYINYT
jgi:hypothetical protein